MKLAFCIDDKNGLSFFGKRQSRDSKIIEDLISRFGGSIYVTDYSKPLFEGHSVFVTEKPTGCDGVFFSELQSPVPYFGDADEIYIYRWNRVYPADKILSPHPTEVGFTLKEKHDIVGSSHDKITLEVYVK